MKANNGKGNNELRDSWETPKWLFDKLNEQYKFSFDCCANYNNTRCPEFSDDFEELDYRDLENSISWMNPPFSKAYVMFKHFFRAITKGVAIYRCDNMETKIWQEIIFPNATWIFIPNKRIAYEGMNGKGSRFPSALIGFKVPIPIGLNGTILNKIT